MAQWLNFLKAVRRSISILIGQKLKETNEKMRSQMDAKIYI